MAGPFPQQRKQQSGKGVVVMVNELLRLIPKGSPAAVLGDQGGRGISVY
jgi:hypothetical protein